MEGAGGHWVPTLAKEPLATESCWRGRLFFQKVALGRSTTLAWMAPNLPHFFWGWTYNWTWSSLIWREWLASNSQGSAPLPSRSWGYSRHNHVGVLHSGPLVYAAGTLPMSHLHSPWFPGTLKHLSLFRAWLPGPDCFSWPVTWLCFLCGHHWPCGGTSSLTLGNPSVLTEIAASHSVFQSAVETLSSSFIFSPSCLFWPCYPWTVLLLHAHSMAYGWHFCS